MNCSKSERALLLAVRNTIRTALSLDSHACDIEMDELVHPTQGDEYVIVQPGGWRPGPRHDSSGGVYDHVFGVIVTVVKRANNIAKDRQREVFLGNLGSLNDLIDKVNDAIDFKHTVIQAANTQLMADNSPDENTNYVNGFVEPLKFAGVERKPRVAPASVFGGNRNSQAAGLMRSISFDGARRIVTRS